MLAPLSEAALPSVGSPSSVVSMLLVSGRLDPLLCCIGLGDLVPPDRAVELKQHVSEGEHTVGFSCSHQPLSQYACAGTDDLVTCNVNRQDVVTGEVRQDLDSMGALVSELQHFWAPLPDGSSVKLPCLFTQSV